jgi:hypothetical protein
MRRQFVAPCQKKLFPKAPSFSAKPFPEVLSFPVKPSPKALSFPAKPFPEVAGKFLPKFPVEL